MPLAPRVSRRGPPDQQPPLDQRHRDVDQDDEDGEHEHAGEHASDVEHTLRLLDQVAEPRGRTQIFADNSAVRVDLLCSMRVSSRESPSGFPGNCRAMRS